MQSSVFFWFNIGKRVDGLLGVQLNFLFIHPAFKNNILFYAVDKIFITGFHLFILHLINQKALINVH